MSESDSISTVLLSANKCPICGALMVLLTNTIGLVSVQCDDRCSDNSAWCKSEKEAIESYKVYFWTTQ